MLCFTDLECPNCVLQWRYIAGNNWGMCPDGTGAVGCGAQEEFRACADINIGDVGPQPPLRPLRPGTKPTTRTKPTDTTSKTSTESEKGHPSETEETASRYLGPIIAALTLLVVLCILASIYLYYYHGQRVKHLMLWKREQKTPIISFPPAMSPSVTTMPPIPPPRTKRLSQTFHEINANESSVLNGSNSTVA